MRGSVALKSDALASHTWRITCRVCRGALDPILSLGEHYVSDFPQPGASDGVRVPLELVMCGACKLLQLTHTVPSEQLYRNYWYRSGTNATMRDALADIAHKAEQLVSLQAGDAVLDIGCNDGTLLAAYRTMGVMRIGFDPARNLLPCSTLVADVIVPTTFNTEIFRYGGVTLRPRIVTSIAMFYDLEDPNQFVTDVKTVMAQDGLWVVQMSYLPSMLRQNAFDNICHEHLEYYSLASMEALLQRHTMQVVDVELNNVNGGSFRLYIRNEDADISTFADETYRALAAERVEALRQAEDAAPREIYANFTHGVKRIKQDVVEFIMRAHGMGQQVFVYGASTKGNTLLQYFGLDHKVIGAAAERNPDKWGRETVGTRIPIISEEEARARKPDYFLVLPWHFVEEFKDRERDYLRAGGRFIVPMPHFTLI